MDVLYILKILWRKKWWLITVPFISAVSAFLISLTLVNQFKATTQIATGFTTNETIRVSDERFSPRDVDLNFSNILAAMNSGICNNLLSYRLILHDLDSAENSFRKPESKSKVVVSPSEVQVAKKIFRQKLEAIELLTLNDEHADVLLKILDYYGYGYHFIKEGLKAYRLPNTDFIQVDFISDDPHLSAFAVNAFCEEFLRYYRGQRQEGSGISVSFFKQLVDQKKKELDEKSETLKTFKATNSLVNPNEEGANSRLLQISDLELERDNIENNIYGLRLSLERFKRELEAIDKGLNQNQGSGNALIVQLRGRISRLNELYINSGSNNPILLDSLNALREQLRSEIAKLDLVRGQNEGLTKTELSAKVTDLEISIAIEESKYNSIVSKIRNLKGSISGYVSKEAVIANLTSEVDVATKEYLEAVNRYNEANNKLLTSTSTIRQIFKATPPATHVSNKRILIVGAAAFASLFFCLFVIVAIEVFDPTLKTIDHFKRNVNLELADQLIKINTQTLNFKALFDSKTNQRDLEIFKEYMRKLRFQIEQTGATTFLVTSCKRGEGKTFLIFTLAYVLSLVNKKILIIDTNFKNNSLSKWLTVKNTEVKLLERGHDFEFRLLSKERNDRNSDGHQDLISATRFPNIFLVGNNGGSESPDEILSGKNFGDLISMLRTEYDYIFLEGPSLNDYSDSKELVKYVEKVIPVFSADSSIGQLDKESIEYLRSLDGKLAGAILNKVELKNLEL